MEGPFNRYLMLARRWVWIVVLGVVVCGGATYVISKLINPTYQATAMFVVTTDVTSAPSSIAAVPTYAQVLANPLVLNPVVVKHKGMTLQQLSEMIIVKPQANTQIIELNVQNGNPRLAAQIANEVGQSYLQYAGSRLPGTLQMLPAQVPTEPIAPKTSRDAGIAALIGLGLAVTLIVIFEWVEDRLSSPENAQELLAQEVLTIIPRLPKRRKPRGKGSIALMEKYRVLAAGLNTVQAIKPFKVVMVTSALPGEGKSTVAVNLAFSLALAGRKILLIDANLRSPVLDQRFQVDNSRGLSTLLLEMSSSPSVDLYSQKTDIPTLRVLTSGSMLTGAAELLQSSQARQFFKYLQDTPFDYVVVDSPALLSVADAQILTSLVQAVLLVVDANKTPRKVLQRTKRVLARTHAKVLGIALNKSPWADYGVEQTYQNGKTRSQEKSHFLMPPIVSPSHPIMLRQSFTPESGSWSKSSDTPSNPVRPLESVNGEVSLESVSISQQKEQSDSQEEETNPSNNPRKQP